MDVANTTTILDGEEGQTWLEMMDRQGLTMPLDEMAKLLDEAPKSAKSMEEYHYLRGLYDGRFLFEELGASVRP